ncbi:hypothetical protein COCMIDRAFT_21784 [Bipolaris oryzae ATCC 44560]|uniref:Formylmethionine deformylase-like protein n=1 Tax=Bipolaris oryzae ATCC 44560 TaxID=930090 RepID=W7A409_COCMI|nr:uncharacterized protein COCMIDRAFT_21784 [Bipolaris oryzae ATCC 44560]EUC50771.1 hypothetical protein COCMIDRAFT_21784 [Bipolaris oryzae ATCC 44560]
MTSLEPSSSDSSRDVSPQTRPEPYDPFHTNNDPIELAHLSRTSLDDGDTYGSRGRSPPHDTDEGIQTGLHPRSMFGFAQSNEQYAPVHERNSSLGPSLQSKRESSYTMNRMLYNSTSRDADTQAILDRRSGELAQWHIYWTTPALVMLLFLAGFAAAVGHHLFYAYLDGKPATAQLKMVRYGTALAFFVKSTLAGCVIICNRQRIWYTFRRKAMTIKGIDGLFSATEDPTQFFMNWEMARNGKLATLMAACTWLIPLASVLSPASLTSQLSTLHENGTCSVANLNFAQEADYDFRDQKSFYKKSLSFFNTTDIKAQQPGWFDYYDQPSKTARRLAFSSVYMQKPQSRENAAMSFCGEGWNCTYSINFLGPGYKCDDLNDTDKDKAPFSMDILAPKGNVTYYADVDQGDYHYQNPKEKGDMLGVIQSEPNLWIGYAINTYQPYAPDSPFYETWKTVHEPRMFKCVMHYTNYTFEMDYSPRQNATRKQRDFLAPVVDTTVQWDDKSNDWTASPAQNFIRPSDDVGKYKVASTYHTLGMLLRRFLRGKIVKNNVLITYTDLSETRLANSSTSYPLVDLKTEMQDLFEDMIITLLSDPNLVAAQTQNTACEKSRTMMVYVYYKQSLWIGYAIVIAITFAFVLVGAWSLYKNGVASDVLFSRIMVTTRNPTLDHLSVGACLGGDPFPKDLTKTKLRFGVLLEDDPREGPLGKVEHCCFGTVGETKEIVKGGTYAGLKEWRGKEKSSVDEKEPLLFGRE